MFDSKILFFLLLISAVGTVFCGFRIGTAFIKKRIRALVKVYTQKDDQVEYQVWFFTTLFLGITFVIIMGMTLWKMFSDVSPFTNTQFYTIVILVLQFSALIAFIPFLVRMLGSGTNKSGDSKDIRRILQNSVTDLAEAIVLLENDFTLESQGTHHNITTTTFSKKTNSSSLIRIESKTKNGEILEIY